MTKSMIRTIALFPLRRPVFSLLSLLCLTTVVVLIGTWQHEWRTGWDQHQKPKTRVLFNVKRGRLMLNYAVLSSADSVRKEDWSLNIGREPCRVMLGRLGLSPPWLKGFYTLYVVAAPLWLIAVLFGIYPLFASYRLYRNRQPPPGHCPQCRYNLTGNLSGVCPECGTPTKC